MTKGMNTYCTCSSGFTARWWQSRGGDPCRAVSTSSDGVADRTGHGIYPTPTRRMERVHNAYVQRERHTVRCRVVLSHWLFRGLGGNRVVFWTLGKARRTRLRHIPPARRSVPRPLPPPRPASCVPLPVYRLQLAHPCSSTMETTNTTAPAGLSVFPLELDP
jgi:hypothetical protein